MLSMKFIGTKALIDLYKRKVSSSESLSTDTGISSGETVLLNAILEEARQEKSTEDELTLLELIKKSGDGLELALLFAIYREKIITDPQFKDKEEVLSEIDWVLRFLGVTELVLDRDQVLGLAEIID